MYWNLMHNEKKVLSYNSLIMKAWAMLESDQESPKLDILIVLLQLLIQTKFIKNIFTSPNLHKT